MGKKRIKAFGADGSESTDGIAKTRPDSASKKSVKKSITKGQAHILSSYNNTIVTLTDANGRVLSWSSAGSLGFKGTRKSTPYVASLVTKSAIEKAKKYNLSEVDIFVKGVGSGRDSAVRALAAAGLTVNIIADITPIPHNGCRPPRARRV